MIMKTFESCDDGVLGDLKGCNTNCSGSLPGFVCDGSTPSKCKSICGDNLVVGDEVCDDGETDGSKGCYSDCS